MSFADLLDVLYEDNHLIGLNKPSGWPTAHFDGTEETVDRLVKSYLKEKHDKPGNVFFGVVHRLDKPVSGALVFARTSKAAARLSEQFRDGAIEKVYWAVVEESSESAAPPWAKQESGSLDDWLLHDDATRTGCGSCRRTRRAGEGGPAAVSGPRPARWAGLARASPAHRPQAPTPGPARLPWLPGLRRQEVRLASPARRRHRPARPVADVLSPGPARAGDAQGRAAEALAGAVYAVDAGGGVMTKDEKLAAILAAVQTDPVNRGLGKVPGNNLFTACAGDFAAACRSHRGAPRRRPAGLHGLLHPHPGRGRIRDRWTARRGLPRPGLRPTGFTRNCLAEVPCGKAIRFGFYAAGVIPRPEKEQEIPPDANLWGTFWSGGKSFEEFKGTHLLAIERVGPAADGRCYTMRGADVGVFMRRVHGPFVAQPPDDDDDRHRRRRQRDRHGQDSA